MRENKKNGARFQRLSIDLPDELANRLNKILPYGVKSELFRALASEFLRIYDEKGGLIIGMVISGQYHLITKDVEFKDRKTGFENLDMTGGFGGGERRLK